MLSIVAAIIIINPIYGLSASSRPRQPSSNRWTKINLKRDNFFNINFSDKLLCFLKSASAKLCQLSVKFSHKCKAVKIIKHL